MYKDLFGKTRAKLGLHIHTTVSDGKNSPEEAARRYKEAGFDAIAITDHWKYGEKQVLEGLSVLPGIEYDIGIPGEKIFHIVCICAESEPTGLTKQTSAQDMVNTIHKCGGLAVLAHPAWSLNTPADIMAVEGFDATEIYNSVSNEGNSFRPDSSILIDMIGYEGRFYPLLATDDVHHYDGKDDCISYIMAECDPTAPDSVKEAIVSKRFYASQSPEIHLTKNGDNFRVDCSPVCKIAFASNQPWCRRVFKGDGITSAEYTPLPTEKFIRAFVVDKDGKYAWSNIISLR